MLLEMIAVSLAVLIGIFVSVLVPLPQPAVHLPAGTAGTAQVRIPFDPVLDPLTLFQGPSFLRGISG